MKFCKSCFMPSTRPRITFTKEGICNGCTWAKKKTAEVDWKARWKELEDLCDKYRCTDGRNWDVIVPCSGGKDSYHIAYSLRYKLNMHPLLVRVSPLIPTNVGERNWRHLAELGYDCIQITPSLEVYGKLSKAGIIEQGRPQMAFESAITTAVLRQAIAYKIPFIMYGEEGESEYAGRMDLAEKPNCTKKWIVDTYFSGFDTDVYKEYGFTKEDLIWWQFPSQKELDKAGIFYTHWSYFEDWNHLTHYETAKKMGLQPAKAISTEDGVAGYGTYTDYTSLDDPYMRTCNTYFMFLKFGYGRGTHESGGDLKRGVMTKKEAFEIAKKYDDYDCIHFKDKLLKHLYMTQEEWDESVDKWANKEILEKAHGKWRLKKEYVKMKEKIVEEEEENKIELKV
jgi:N-acetyl sugar amidotransferase